MELINAIDKIFFTQIKKEHLSRLGTKSHFLCALYHLVTVMKFKATTIFVLNNRVVGKTKQNHKRMRYLFYKK